MIIAAEKALFVDGRIDPSDKRRRSTAFIGRVAAPTIAVDLWAPGGSMHARPFSVTCDGDSGIRAGFLALTLAGWALGADLAGAAGAARDDPVWIEDLRGWVEVLSPGASNWVSTTRDQSLSAGWRLRTEPNSRVTLRWSDSSVLTFGALTEIEILPPPEAGSRFGLNLLRGVMYFFHRERPGRIRVITRGANASVEGTEFVIQAEPGPAGRTTVSVIDGRVRFENDQGWRTITTGQQAVAEISSAPRLTAGFIVNNVIQWALYYPAVLDVNDLAFSPEEARALRESLEAYQQGDLLAALAAYPPRRTSASEVERVYRAALLLSVGEVETAAKELDNLSRSTGSERIERLAGALKTLVDAVKQQPKRASFEPVLPTELLAESYYQQSLATGDAALHAALAAARMAAAGSPDFGFARARVAELEFSFGRIGPASQALRWALSFTPRNAQALALQGFLLAAENRTAEAIEWFEQALSVDSGLGNAWLGRGLCRIRRGDARGGLEDLLMAAALEPQRSLLRSYLGKAFDHAHDPERARHELERAIALDEGDPTPWLYRALLNHRGNRLNEGIHDLERSQALNDNRRIFRSRLLLDQDRAVRGANLAQLFQDNGMTEVARREATRAVESDYRNPSAHLFLANAYDALRDPTRVELRYEAPWFNELLLANLLAPVGGGRLSQFVSQQEYSRLLERDGLGASLVGEWRSDARIRSAVSGFGTYGKTEFGLDVAYWESDLGRPNSDDQRLEIYAQFKHEITPSDQLYFLGKWQWQESGDTLKTYDNTPGSTGLRFEEKQEPGLLLAGWNHQWGPSANTLFLVGRLAAEQTLTDPRAEQWLFERYDTALYPGFLQENGGFHQFTDPALRTADPPAVSYGPDGRSVIYSPALLEGIAPFLGAGEVRNARYAPFDFHTRRRFEICSAEWQHIQQIHQHTLILGGRFQAGEFETETRLEASGLNEHGVFSSPAAHQRATGDFLRIHPYAYDFWNVTPWLTLMGGVSWSRIEYPANFRRPPISDEQTLEEHLSGKAGFTLSPSRWFRLRGLYTETLGGVTFDESVTLEPVQLAGFSQTYRTVLSESIAGSVEAPRFTIWGLGLDGALPTRTWWGVSLQLINQDVERASGAFSGYSSSAFLGRGPVYFPHRFTEVFAYREQRFEAVINQLLDQQFSVGALYRITRSQLHRTWPEIPVSMRPEADWHEEATLHETSLFVNWNSPRGFFARGEANWYSQHLADDPGRLILGEPQRTGDDFWQFNVWVGYRFRQNRAEIALGALNLSDADYRLSPLTPYGDIPRERTVAVRCRFSF